MNFTNVNHGDLAPIVAILDDKWENIEASLRAASCALEQLFKMHGYDCHVSSIATTKAEGMTLISMATSVPVTNGEWLTTLQYLSGQAIGALPEMPQEILS